MKRDQNGKKIMLAGNHQGFTLIEAMIALFVFAVAGLALVSMQVGAIKANTLANSITEKATSIGAEQIETFFAHHFQDSTFVPSGTVPNMPTGTTATYTVQNNAVLNSTMLITLTVTWTEGDKPVGGPMTPAGQRTQTYQFVKPQIF